jgi:phage terminase small subunit
LAALTERAGSLRQPANKFSLFRVGLRSAPVGSRGPLLNRRLQVLKGDGRNRGDPRAVVAPDKPPDLEPEAERLWDQVVPELGRRRLLSRLDGVTLEALCTTSARWKRHDGGRGYAALTTALGRLARDAGLAPAARQRMTAPAVDRAELERSIFGTESCAAPRSRCPGGSGASVSIYSTAFTRGSAGWW